MDTFSQHFPSAHGSLTLALGQSWSRQVDLLQDLHLS